MTHITPAADRAIVCGPNIRVLERRLVELSYDLRQATREEARNTLLGRPAFRPGTGPVAGVLSQITSVQSQLDWRHAWYAVNNPTVKLCGGERVA